MCPMLSSPFLSVRNRICKSHRIFLLVFAFKSIHTSVLCQLPQNHWRVWVARDLKHHQVSSPQLNYPTWKLHEQNHYLLYLGHKRSHKIVCFPLVQWAHTHWGWARCLAGFINKNMTKKAHNGVTNFVFMVHVAAPRRRQKVTTERRKQTRVL